MSKGAPPWSENVTESGGVDGVRAASRSWAEMPGSCGVDKSGYQLVHSYVCRYVHVPYTYVCIYVCTYSMYVRMHVLHSYTWSIYWLCETKCTTHISSLKHPLWNQQCQKLNIFATHRIHCNVAWRWSVHNKLQQSPATLPPIRCKHTTGPCMNAGYSGNRMKCWLTKITDVPEGSFSKT